jgi:hypothetical protein
MTTRKIRKQLLLQNVKMDGSINFMTNGDINVYPCPWEDEKQVTGGERVRYRAGIEVDADGHTRVKRYNIGANGPLHDTLFETPHGAVKITRPQIRPSDGCRRLSEEFVYVTFKFPKKYGLALTRTFYEEEADQILSYLKTMNCLSEREQSKHVFDLPSVKTVECNSKEETIWK